MTFSIVAADLDAGDWGVAVASKFVSVGAVVPWAKAGVGAVATQSWANTSFGPEGLALMTDGASAEDALGTLIDGDEGRADRQVGVVDSAGRAATFTGSACMEWAGGATGRGFAAQGNILVGGQVVEAMSGAFSETVGDLCDRLLAALLAGDAAGGTGAAGSPPRSSWSVREVATKAGTTATSTFGWTIIPTRPASSLGSSTSTTRAS